MDKNVEKTIKSKIILFVVGALVGAIISTASFLVYVKTIGVNNSSNNDSSAQMQGGTPPEMPSGDNNQGGTPPEMPSGDNSSSQNNN